MLSIEGGDLASDNDIGSGMANTTSREDILKKALTRFLKKN